MNAQTAEGEDENQRDPADSVQETQEQGVDPNFKS